MEERKSGDRDVRVLKLQGYLDVHTVDALEKALDDLLAAGLCRVVLDMKKLTYLSSIAYGALAQAEARASKLGGDLKVARPSEKVRRIADSLGLVAMLEFHDTVEAALNAFSKS
jgi:anti-anti-sigma factor